MEESNLSEKVKGYIRTLGKSLKNCFTSPSPEMINDTIEMYNGKRFIRNLGKKGFLIEIDDETALLSKNGYIPPSPEVMQTAIEKYCEKNHHKLTYIRLADPIVFMIDDKEAYEARPELFRRGIVPEYVIRCTEFK